MNNAPKQEDKQTISKAERRSQVIGFLTELKEAFKGDPALQAEARKILGASGATQQRTQRNRPTTDTARQFVLAVGENRHADPDFAPVPPQHIKDAGDGAVAMYHQKWREGFQRGEVGGFTDDMIELPGGENMGVIR